VIIQGKTEIFTGPDGMRRLLTENYSDKTEKRRTEKTSFYISCLTATCVQFRHHLDVYVGSGLANVLVLEYHIQMNEKILALIILLIVTMVIRALTASRMG